MLRVWKRERTKLINDKSCRIESELELAARKIKESSIDQQRWGILHRLAKVRELTKDVLLNSIFRHFRPFLTNQNTWLISNTNCFFLAELGKPQHCRDNVNHDLGTQQDIDYCIMAMFVVTTPFRHMRLSTFACHWSSNMLSRCHVVAMCPALPLRLFLTSVNIRNVFFKNAFDRITLLSSFSVENSGWPWKGVSLSSGSWALNGIAAKPSRLSSGTRQPV